MYPVFLRGQHSGIDKPWDEALNLNPSFSSITISIFFKDKNFMAPSFICRYPYLILALWPITESDVRKKLLCHCKGS